MKRLLLLLISVLSTILILVIPGCNFNQPRAVNPFTVKPTGLPTMAEKTAVFDRIWELFDEHYPDFQLKVINWQNTKKTYRPLALQASTWPEFFQIINQMILTLHDPHCRLIGVPLPPFYYPNLITRFVDNQLVVVAAPQTPRLRPGMIILGLNGESLSERIRDAYKSRIIPPFIMLQYLFPDWFRPVQGQIQELFSTPSPSPENITVMDPHSGDIKNVSVPVCEYTKLYDLWKKYLHAHEYLQRQYLQRPTLQVREMGDNILYIGISEMSADLDAKLQNYMPQIIKAKGIIIDVRNNGGGYLDVETWIARHFYPKGMAPIQERYLINGHLGGWINDFLSPLAPHISAPTAVLVNGGDASATEMFIAQMEAAPNVRTFGSRTLGASGLPEEYPIMDGVSILIPDVQYRVASTDQFIEGVGIAPEESVHESYSGFMTELHLIQDNQTPDSADEVLQAAKGWLSAQIYGFKNH